MLQDDVNIIVANEVSQQLHVTEKLFKNEQQNDENKIIDFLSVHVSKRFCFFFYFYAHCLISTDSCKYRKKGRKKNHQKTSRKLLAKTAVESTRGRKTNLLTLKTNEGKSLFIKNRLFTKLLLF